MTNETMRVVNKYLTLKEAAKLARVSRATMYRWLAKGIIPDRRMPGTRKALVLATDLTREPMEAGQ